MYLRRYKNIRKGIIDNTEIIRRRDEKSVTSFLFAIQHTSYYYNGVKSSMEMVNQFKLETTIYWSGCKINFESPLHQTEKIVVYK